MDSISDSDSEDAGSIPAGTTIKQTLKQPSPGAFCKRFASGSLYCPEAIDGVDLLQENLVSFHGIVAYYCHKIQVCFDVNAILRLHSIQS